MVVVVVAWHLPSVRHDLARILHDSNFYELWCHLEEEGWTFNFTTRSDKHVHQHREAYDPAGSPPCKHVWVNPHGARRKHYLLALALGQFVVPHGLSDRSYKSLIIGKKAPTAGKRKKNEFLLMGSGLAEPLRKTPKSSRGGRGGRRVRHHGRARGRGRGRIGAGGGVAGAHDSGSEEADGEVGEHEEGDRPESEHSQASLGEIESIDGGVRESDAGSDAEFDADLDAAGAREEPSPGRGADDNVETDLALEAALAEALDEDICPPVPGDDGDVAGSDMVCPGSRDPAFLVAPPLAPPPHPPPDVDDLPLDAWFASTSRPGPAAPPPPPPVPPVAHRGGARHVRTVDKYPRLHCILPGLVLPDDKLHGIRCVRNPLLHEGKWDSMRAICGVHGERCEVSRSLNENLSRLAQGRPLGLLRAWLLAAQGFPDKASHCRAADPRHRPEHVLRKLAARQDGRLKAILQIHTLPAGQRAFWLQAERPPWPDEAEEPDVCP